jgi:glycosyltransferase involved in cell wall biosynthesis
MHIVTVSPSIPAARTGGGGNWNSSLIKFFRREGHKVTHIAVLGKHSSITPTEDERRQYQQLGVDLVTVPYQTAPPEKGIISKIGTVLNPSIANLWPNEARTQPLVQEALEKLQPDCVVPFAFDAVLYTDRYSASPRVAVQAEGPYINTYVNWRYDPAVSPKNFLRYVLYSVFIQLQVRAEETVYAKLCRRLTVAAFQGPHYVNWAKRRGIRQARFVTTPTPDTVGKNWKSLREQFKPNDRCRILMIGHLHSTSNRSGLPILFFEVLPYLEKHWGNDKFEIHIVGNNENMPARFNSYRNHPALRFRGPVFPADSEFQQADLLLVTVPAKTGSRVRIINGFSYGCCVVAHSANALGIPELKHGWNVLLGSDGESIAKLVISAAGDKALREKLARNGRKTYDDFYSEDIGGKQYMRLIEEAVATTKGKGARA